MNNAYDSAWSIAQILIRGQVQQGLALTRDMIEAKVDLALQMDPNIKTQVDREHLVADLESSFTVWMGKAVTLENNEDHIAWLNSRKSDIDWKFWKRYQRLLQQKRWAAASIEKLAVLEPRMLACMHGSAWTGDGAKLLRALARAFDAQ